MDFSDVRRCGHSPHDAQDLTQGFFCQLLEKRWLDSADREKGRLRTFLVVALKRYMAKEWRRACAQKRGGGEIHIPMDTAFAESRYASDAGAELRPEELFDREWAPKTCPQCGAALPANAPAGLCPRCVMEMNMASQTEFSYSGGWIDGMERLVHSVAIR